ncbi:MAG: polyketide synthase dehydratase domain-containing protein [Phycisphaerales bacterium]|nr:polyketide synthase dehydratase domain-containing protein [Phycisphaerales bacterium]
MHFCLVDRVLEQTPERIVTIKQVSAAEEYLQDHFPGFPVLPGVLMIEALVQAARRLVEDSSDERLVLGAVRALKYGTFVRPGQVLRAEVTLGKRHEDGTIEFRGEGRVLTPAGGESAGGGAADPPVAVSGRFTLRPIRLGRSGATG